MRYLLVAASLLLGSLTSAQAQFSVSIATPSVNIGINMPVYPELVPVPGYPVYYAPRASANYFFYDGAYWVYAGDNSWYASSWYNGPWHLVGPEYVPLYVLRVPVRYYRVPPPYFHGWRPDAPPRWGQHWGRDWEERRRGWNHWDRSSVPRPAPLPAYQRAYAGDRYPVAPEHQHSIRAENYRYQPREEVTRQHFVQPGNPGLHRGWQAEPQRQGPPPPRPGAPPPQEHGRNGYGPQQAAPQTRPAAQPDHDHRPGYGHERQEGGRDQKDDRGGHGRHD
jgi:hypothetical protein